jgi:hypothetical protein
MQWRLTAESSAVAGNYVDITATTASNNNLMQGLASKEEELVGSCI